MMNAIKVLGIVGSILGMAGTVITTISQAKGINEAISKKVAEEVAKQLANQR